MSAAAKIVKCTLKSSAIYWDLGKSWGRTRAMGRARGEAVRFISAAECVIWLDRRIVKKVHDSRRPFRQNDIARVSKKAAVGAMVSLPALLFWRRIGSS
jgi:hypothetical protein